MNYTTLPNTNRITNWVAVGLSWKYQLSYRSGYLTLQRTLNDFALSRLRQSVDPDENDESCSDISGANEFGTFGMPFPTPKYNQVSKINTNTNFYQIIHLYTYSLLRFQ